MFDNPANGPRIALSNCMSFEKMKALMETIRGASKPPLEPDTKQLFKRDARPDWKYLDHVAKERIAA